MILKNDSLHTPAIGIINSVETVGISLSNNTFKITIFVKAFVQLSQVCKKLCNLGKFLKILEN